MKNIKHFERLQQLHERIKAENTRTPKEMAAQMQISERALLRLVSHLRDFGAEIRFSEKRKTYYYLEFFDIKVVFSVEVFSKGESIQVYGGSYFFKKKYSLQGFGSERRYF